MKLILRILTFVLVLGMGTAVSAQQRRPTRAADTGPVTVLRSATLQMFVSSDAVSVFGYLSDQEKLTAWLADQAILEPHFGGKYHFRWKTQEPADGVVTEFVSDNTLALTWKHPNEETETQVRFKLSPQGGQTLVELQLQGFTTAEALEKSVKSWVFRLQNLKSVIEDQVDLRQTAGKSKPHAN